MTKFMDMFVPHALEARCRAPLGLQRVAKTARAVAQEAFHQVYQAFHTLGNHESRKKCLQLSGGTVVLAYVEE